MKQQVVLHIQRRVFLHQEKSQAKKKKVQNSTTKRKQIKKATTNKMWKIYGIETFIQKNIAKQQGGCGTLFFHPLFWKGGGGGLPTE